MKDTMQQSIQSFKNEVFIWEIAITVVVFAAIYVFMKKFKATEKRAVDENRKYETFDN